VRLASLVLGVALSASLVGVASTARGDSPIFYGCYEEAEIFHSLKYGDFDFCRGHLRYTPGAFDCLRIVASTCNVWWPERRHWEWRRGLAGTSERIVCPPGPPPPTCPPGFPPGGIPR
jgi:hypothetical protein